MSAVVKQPETNGGPRVRVISAWDAGREARHRGGTGEDGEEEGPDKSSLKLCFLSLRKHIFIYLDMLLCKGILDK